MADHDRGEPSGNLRQRASTASAEPAADDVPDASSASSNPYSISARYDAYYSTLREYMWKYNFQKFCWEQQQQAAHLRLQWQQLTNALAASVLESRNAHTNIPGAHLRVFPQGQAPQVRVRVPQAAQNHPQIFVGAYGPNHQVDTTWKGFKTAPIWKRVAAEVIDIFILMFIKLFFTFTIFDTFALMDLSKYQGFLDGEVDITADVAIDLMADLAVLEFIHRLISCAYEAMMTVRGFEHAGATVGKKLMGLRVVTCSEFILLDGMIVVKPGETPTLRQATLRAFLKNYSWAMFIPLSLTAFLNKERRCTYDSFCKCIVVEVGDPLIRRFIPPL